VSAARYVVSYRFGHSRVSENGELFQFAVPLSDPRDADSEAIARYAVRPIGGHPTAVALGILDIEGPWFRRVEHWGLFHSLLDGHHKTAAAAATAQPVRVLSLVSVGESMADKDACLRLPRLLGGLPS
jgi:hypothetical protein